MDQKRGHAIAHTLGNPFNIKSHASPGPREHELWMIEDNCDALSSKYDGRLTGTFSLAVSFYPAHHITIGKRLRSDEQRAIKSLVRSARDWESRLLVHLVSQTLAANALSGNWAICLMATITNISTAMSATT
ncbi:MAG: DegT/DnrJ/EryC1/StrS family aminotransferase [Candidatus Obscuribacterales bacterium]